MGMTSKERMLKALGREKPDRVPATIHQWQPYHLKYYMNNVSDIQAFQEVGLDAAISVYIPEAVQGTSWRISSTKGVEKGNNIIDYVIETPEGALTFRIGYNEFTVWVIKPLIKRDEDIYLYKKYKPLPRYDKKLVQQKYDELGDNGIIRAFIVGNQGGCWQDACYLHGTEEMIMATYDKPEWVHEFLNVLLDEKLAFIYESLKGIKVDLIETGGGASSSTVISPKIHEEFCLPYDTKIHEAIHDVGHIVVYHTCGGVMPIIDLIAANKCDASETLSPPGVGGDITNPSAVKERLGRKVALIGGLDQFNILTDGDRDCIREEVFRIFEGYGPDGGYIMSASDHFFNVEKEKLIWYAEAAKECVY
jgi:uroporphyrinogen-III decarboxylase